ncbi:MAG: VWA domain-containing protein [Dehalococcoidia bacterium]|nr:VWA domain-containing protein [Dehalococcoidia bacterium]
MNLWKMMSGEAHRAPGMVASDQRVPDSAGRGKPEPGIAGGEEVAPVGSEKDQRGPGIGEGETGQPGSLSAADEMPRVSLAAQPERCLIRPNGSYRHIAFRIVVGRQPSQATNGRLPVTLGLVIDRSGSMAGDHKMDTAKKSALAVLERLQERDRVAVVIFDDKIDLLQAIAPATSDIKARVRESLSRIEARGSTALHEGWLTGCQAIAADSSPESARGLSRLFLLTDGLANVGLTDPERIASEAAGVRENARIGTSTFGIGPDYAEGLLGPMAVAGGGQFHHLRDAGDIASAFIGELGELLAVAAGNVRLEVEVGKDVGIEVVSAYWLSGPQDPSRRTLAVGDLMADEERPVVVRFGFPELGRLESQEVRARAAWVQDGVERRTEWQGVRFTYASHQACDAEQRDPAVMRWVGVHHAERAKREATERNQRGDFTGARRRLQSVARHIEQYAGDDQVLCEAVQELSELEPEMACQMSPMDSKEMTFQSQRISRGQRDLRRPPSEPPGDPSDEKK